MKKRPSNKKSKNFLKSIGILLLLLSLALVPAYSTSLEFLDALETEIQTLEMNWNTLQLDLKEQKMDYQNLLTITSKQENLQQNNEKRLQTLETDIQILKTLPQKLETQYSELNNSLKQSEKELRAQRIKTDVLTIGVISISIVSLIFLFGK
jgi:septation ring formation regulator EzrA